MVARKLLSVVALAAVLATGCTSENNPVSPNGSTEDTTPPAVPQNVGSVEARGLWIMSWAANAEADLAGYNVYRYDPDPSRENSYVKVNASTITNTTYTLPTHPGDLQYKVRAVDQTGNQSGLSQSAWSAIPEIVNGQVPGGDEIKIGRP